MKFLKIITVHTFKVAIIDCLLVLIITASMSLEAKGNAIQPLQLVEGETLGQLADGVLGILQPEMIRVQQSLEELTYVSSTAPPS